MTCSGEGVSAGATPIGPVTAADVEVAVRLAVEALGTVRDEDLRGTAGSLEWDCWETVEHIGDAFFYYAVQMGPDALSLDRPLPFDWHALRPSGPHNIIFADRAAGPEGLRGVLQSCAALLTAALRTTPAHRRAYHVYGLSDPEGFAAMGAVETLVHMYDVAEGRGIPWPRPPICAPVSCTGSSRRCRPASPGPGPPCCGPVAASPCPAGPASQRGAGTRRPHRSERRTARPPWANRHYLPRPGALHRRLRRRLRHRGPPRHADAQPGAGARGTSCTAPGVPLPRH